MAHDFIGTSRMSCNHQSIHIDVTVLDAKSRTCIFLRDTVIAAGAIVLRAIATWHDKG